MFPVDVRPKLEYRASLWLQNNLPHERVFLPGSLDKWFNAFTDGEQFSGGSPSTAYNPVQQLAQQVVFQEANPAVSLLWLQAFGVRAIAVVGPRSEEFWKPYAHPESFARILEPLWSEHDTTIYRVPARSASYAHVVPASTLVRRKPDQQQLARYVGALNDPAMPLASWHWLGHSAADIHAVARSGEAVSFQITYAPGWRATINGAPVALPSDGLGLSYLEPPHPGPSHIELRFVGSWEEWFCRVASYIVLLSVLAYLFWGGFNRGRSAQRRELDLPPGKSS
jgi:hypothetical protein